MNDKSAEQVTAAAAAADAAQKEAALAASKEATRLTREKKSADAKAAKDAAAVVKEAKKAAKDAANAAKEAAKVTRLVAHGITRPADGTATSRVWEISDQLSAAAKAPASRADVLKVAGAEGLNLATCATQYGRWRVYNGLKGTDIQGKPVAAADPVEAGPSVEAEPAE